MEYTFSWATFMVGILILIASGAVTAFYQPLADNLGSGTSSYDKFRLWGLIGCALGIIVMLNLHSLFIDWALGGLFGR